MSIASTITTSRGPQPADPPQPRRWTRDEYYRLGELGFFGDQRVQLIDGEIIQMSPQNNPHAVAIGKAMYALLSIFPPSDFWVRIQLPISMAKDSEPEPDLAVVAGKPVVHNDHPRSALLVVEVSDDSLAFDRRRKAALYARAGIADYWIINVRDRQLEVFRDPVADASAPAGYGYASHTILQRDAAVAPLAAPSQSLSVSDLVP